MHSVTNIPPLLLLAALALTSAAATGCKGVRRALVDALDNGYPPPEGTLDAPTFDGPDAARPRLDIRLEPIASGFAQITDVHFVPDDPGRLVVLEKTGKATIVSLETGETTTLLEVPVRVVSEQGLLGLAWHPNFTSNGRFFVHYTPSGTPEHLGRVEEWHVSTLADGGATPVRTVLEVEQPYQNHNAGQLAFGPDGMLYVGWGDGGFRNDPEGHGQDATTFLGAMLRLDVDDRPAGAGYGVPSDNPFVDDAAVPDETWAIGLRNPWRYSFAPDGRLVIADVGQDQWEEISIARPGDNLGWNLREGRHCFPPSRACDANGMREPIYEYGRDDGSSITGGFVVTGGPIPELVGRYVFGDFVSGRLWAIDLPDGEPGASPVPTATALGKWPILASTFALDADGAIHVADYSGGAVYRLAPRPIEPPAGDPE